ncbi:putative transcriptional regulator [Nocardia farcinica IFM 10152]|uniref:Putative transcriptional regulator n=1 Tax=Nocardia farcinica (strain IFM 10152) TaxID=247156 RepID=Q5YY61_NOCFA|nr:putative transcriptional regulator [Nocardia farcinica IFM 10152]
MFTDGASVSGGLLRELRTVAGIGLRTMAVRTNYTVGYLSLVETGRKPVTTSVLAGYRAVLGDPLIGMPDVDPERVQATVTDPASAGRSSLDDVATILERARRLEDTAGPELVVTMVRGMDGVARALAAARVGGASAAGLAAEVATYRGWLEHDTGKYCAATKAFTDAALLAQEAGDHSQLAHALCFRAFTTQRQGQLAHALDLTGSAARVTGAHPVLGVYAAHQRAELLAMRGDRRQSEKALARAESAAVAADGVDLPTFGYWYTSGYWAVHRGVVLSLLGRVPEAVREAEQGLTVMPEEHRKAGWMATLLRELHPEMNDYP